MKCECQEFNSVTILTWLTQKVLKACMRFICMRQQNTYSELIQCTTLHESRVLCSSQWSSQHTLWLTHPFLTQCRSSAENQFAQLQKVEDIILSKLELNIFIFHCIVYVYTELTLWEWYQVYADSYHLVSRLYSMRIASSITHGKVYWDWSICIAVVFRSNSRLTPYKLCSRV